MDKVKALAAFGLLAAALVGCAYYHVVQPGDTLYDLSKEYGVSVQDIQQQNPGIDPYNLQPGDRLRIPRMPNQFVADSTSRQEKNKPAAAEKPSDKPPPADNAEPTPAPRDGAKPADKPRADNNAPVAPPPAAVVAKPKEKTRFIWPVQGKVTAKFGEQADGVVSHGIEISAVDGAPVAAAADGKVILASDQFKGYGNMIVVRHDDNFFTIYSFNRTMLVKKGDDVKRGQKIAEVGKTGRAVTPTLHFQVRIGSKAVDPLPYLPAQP